MKTADGSRLADIAERLIAVGEESFGTYVWQRTQDPYTIFVAEYFLRRSNRTTVERFLPGFLELFPDADSLCRAAPDAIAAHARWAGMRSRSMHLPGAVTMFMEIDRPTAASLCTIPHVGPYAAGAIALYGFGEPNFPVDGNVRRVLSRFLGLTDPGQFETAVDAVAQAAHKLGGPLAVKHAHFGALTIGWTNCRVRRRCGGCPLASTCLSSSTSTPDGCA